jgi:hypothetical protein
MGWWDSLSFYWEIPSDGFNPRSTFGSSGFGDIRDLRWKEHPSFLFFGIVFWDTVSLQQLSPLAVAHCPWGTCP